MALSQTRFSSANLLWRNISPSSGGCVDLTRFFFGYGGAARCGGGTADAAGGLGGTLLTYARVGVYAD